MLQRSKRLLATTCLTAAVVSTAALFPAKAQEAAGRGALKWGAHGDFVGRTAHEHSAAGVEIFVPIRQNESSLVFIDGSINGDFEEEVYGSFGLGFRHILNPELILGGIVALDYTRSENGKSYGAVTLGAEAIGRMAEARVNVQLPFSGSEQIGEELDVESDAGTLSLIDHRLVERFSSERSRIDEVPLTGIEGEVGVNLPIGFDALDDDLRAFAGAYHYSGDGIDDFTGVSGRLEYRVRDVLGELSPGSELILSAGATHDGEYGTNFAGEVRLRVPLGAPPRPRTGVYALSEIEERMTQRVVRNSRIHTSERRTVTEVVGSREAVVVDPRTGRPYGAIFFADGADTPGAGTKADPTTLAGAVAGTGAGGIVVAEGNNGTIDTPGVTLADRQSVLGGGTAVPVRLADGTVTNFVLGEATPTIQGGATANVITLGRDNTLRSLNIVGGISGVAGTNVGALTIEDLSIASSGGTGLAIRNTAGDNAISVTGLSVSGAGGAGISIDGLGGGSTAVTDFSGVSVASAAAGGVLFDGVVFDADPGAAGFQRVETGDLAIGDPANPAAVSGDGLRLNQVLGDLSAGDLTIANSGGAGLFIRDDAGKTGRFAFGNTGGSVTTRNGAALDIDPVALAARFSGVSSTNAGGQGSGGTSGIFIDTITARDAGSAALTIGTTTVVGSAGDGIFVANAAGPVAFGTTRVEDSGGNGIRLTGNSGAISFGDTSVIDAGATGIDIEGNAGGASFGATRIERSAGDGIRLTANSGTMIFGDTQIADPGADGIDIEGANGQVSFGHVDITGLGTATGLDLTDDAASTRVALAFETLDITGTGAAGSIGIDYSGTTNPFDVVTLDSGTIRGVTIGIDLTNAATTGTFRYGDGSATDADGRASTIDATQPLAIAGLSGASGIYDLRDVNFVGDISNISGVTTFFVDADGGNDPWLADGTASDPGTIAQAIASGADVIALVDNQAGGQDVIDAAALIQGSPDSLTLAANQRLISFLVEDLVDVGGGSGVPNNLLLSGVPGNAIRNPNPGSGAPILTTTEGGANTLVLGNDNLVVGVVVSNGGGANAIFGNGTAGLTVRDSRIASVFLSNATGGARLTDSVFERLAVAGGSVSITGANADFANATGQATVAISGGHSGAIGFDAASGFAATNGTGLQFDNADGAYAFNGAVVLNGGGAGIDILNGSSGTFTFADARITSPSGTALNIAGSAPVLTLGGSIVQGNAAPAVSISGMAGGSATINASVSATNGTGLQFDNADGTYAFNGVVVLNGGGAGIDILNGSSGTFTFADARITSPSGTALNIAGSAPVLTLGGSITQNNAASAVSITGMTGGSATIGGRVTANTSTATAIDLAGNTGGAVAFDGGLDIDTTTGVGLRATGGGTLRVRATGGNESITTTGGQALNLSGITADIAFDSLSSTASGTSGIGIDTVAGTFSVSGAMSVASSGADGIALTSNAAGFSFATIDVTDSAGNGVRFAGNGGTISVSGATTIATAGAAGLLAENNSGAVSLGTLQVSNTAADGVSLTGNSGAFTVAGGTTIVNPGAAGIDIEGTNGRIGFADVDVTGLAANGVGLDFNGATLTQTVDFASLDVTGTGGTPPAGSIGIDLRGVLGGQVIDIGRSSAPNPAADTPSIISNVATGVFLDAASDANFTFGDGEDVTDRASRLGAATPINAGSAPAQGNYNFLDVDFGGASPGIGFGTATVFFFTENGTGSGSSPTDPGSVAAAEASSATVLVPVGTSAINVTVDGLGSLDIDNNQDLAAFATPGGTIDVFFAAPSTIMISAVDRQVRDTAGNGSPELTNASPQAVISLGGSNRLTNVRVNGSGGAGISANAVNSITLANIAVSNTAGAGLAFDTLGNSLVSQGGLAITASGGAGLSIFNSSMAATFSGLVAVDNRTTGGGGLSLTNNAGASFGFGGGLDIQTSSGTGFLASGGGEITVASAGTKQVVTGTGQVLNWTGVAVGASGAALGLLQSTGTVAADAILLSNVDGAGNVFSAATVSVADTSGTSIDDFDGLEISGGSAATFSFGSVMVSSAGDEGIELNGSNGAVTFGTLNIGATGEFGLSVVNAGANVTVTGATAITNASSDGINITGIGAGATLSFGATTSISGSGRNGIRIENGATGSTAGFAAVAIDGSGAQGLFLSNNAGAATISGGRIGRIGGTGATNNGAVEISGGTGAVTVGADLGNSAGAGVVVENRAAGAGLISFGGTLDHSGSGVGIQLLSNTGGTVSFTNASADALTLNGTGGGILATNNTGGTFEFAAISATQAGANEAIDINAASGGAAYNFNGQVTVRQAGASATAVSVAGTATHTVSFLGGLDIESGTNAGFLASGGATIAVANAGTRRIVTSTGRILDWSGVDVAAGGAAFTTLQATGIVNGFDGIRLSDADGAGTFSGGAVTVAGTSGAGSDGIEISGGSAATFGFGTVTIDGAGASGILLSGANGNVTVNSVDIDGTGLHGIDIANATSAVTISGGSIGASTSPSGSGVRIDQQAASSTITLTGLAVTTATADALAITDSAGTINMTGGLLSHTGADDALDIAGGSATINIGAAISHSGGGAAAQAVEIDGTAGNITLSGNVTTTAGADLFAIGTNSAPTAGTIAFTGANLTASGGGQAIIGGLGGGASVDVDGAISITDASGGASLSVANAAGSVEFGAVTIANGMGAGIDLGAGAGTVSFGGQVTVTNPGGTAVSVTRAGTVNFNGGLDVSSGAQAGFVASGGATITVDDVGTRQIVTTTGRILDWSGVDIASGGAAFTTLQSTGTAAADAIRFNDVDGAGTFSGGAVTIVGTSGAGWDGIEISGGSAATFNFGTVAISNTGGSGIHVVGDTSGVGFGQTTVTNAGGDGISLIANSGTIGFTGTTTINNPGINGVDIEGTVGGAISFADLDITLGTANTTGFDLSNEGATQTVVNAPITAGDFDLVGDMSSGGLVGTLGVNLVGTTGSGVVWLGGDVASGQNATIAGVARGILFSGTTNLGVKNTTPGFVFGDGEAPPESSIETFGGGRVIDDNDGNPSVSSLPMAGEYDFDDVNFTGDTDNLTAISVYYVDQEGNGDGSLANPGSVTGAEGSTANVFILVDTDNDMTSDAIDMASGTFDLADGQVLISFDRNDGPIDVSALGVSGSGAPDSFSFSTIQNSPVISAPTSGIDTVRPTLTTSNATAAILLPTADVNAAGITGGVERVIVSNTGTGDGIAVNASLASSFVLNRNTITAGGQALDVDESAATLAANTLLFRADGNIFASTGTSPAVEFTGRTVSATKSSIGIRSFADNAVTSNGTGGGVTFTRVDFDGDGSDTQANGGTLTIGQNAGGPAAAGDRVQGYGLRFVDPTGDIGFSAVNIANNGDTGLSVEAKTTTFNLAVNSGGANNANIDTTNGTALFLDPLTMDLVFTSVRSTNAPIGAPGGGAGVFVDEGDASGGVASNALTIGTLNVSGAAGNGVFIRDSVGAFTVANAAITGSGGRGVELVGANGAVTFTNAAINGSGGYGFGVTNNTNTVTVSGGNIGSTTTNTGGLIVDGTGGGTGGISIGANVVNSSGGGQAVSIQNRAGGTVTVAGNVTDSGAGVRLLNNTGGTATFQTGLVDLNMSGVLVSGNSTAFVANFNGNLDIDSTSAGFTATGAGTVNVAAAATASVNTAGNSAVVIDGVTSNISFDDVTGIGSGTAADGILLNALGAGSSFAVTGATTLNDYYGGGTGTSAIRIDNIAANGVTISFGATNIDTVANSITPDEGIRIRNVSGQNADIDFGAVSFGNAATAIRSNTALDVRSITGAGFDLDVASLTVNSAFRGLWASDVDAGSVTIAGTTTTTNLASTAIEIGNSSGGFGFNGAVTITNSAGNGGRGILLSGNRGGIAFGGMTTVSIQSAVGVEVTSGSGLGTRSFNGLDITTVDANGLVATNPGNLSILGSDNDISVGAAVAATLTGVPVSSGGIALDQLTSTGGTSGLVVSGLNVANAPVAINSVAFSNHTGSAVSLTDISGANTFTLGSAGITLGTGGVGIDVGPNSAAAVNIGTAAGGITVNGGATGLRVNGASTALNIGTGAGFLSIGATTGPTGNGLELGPTSAAGGTINIGNATNASSINGTGADGIAAVSLSGTVNISNLAITDAGAVGIDHDSAGGTLNLDGVTIDGTAQAGITIDSSAGEFNMTGGSIDNTTGDGVTITGGAGTVTIGASITKTGGAGEAVEVSGHTGRFVTFSGAISRTGASQTGILVQNSFGVVTFSGGSKVLSTQADTAVDLTNNFATINFLNGGLDIDTTSGLGFNAFGSGGEIAIRGANNTITTDTGRIIRWFDVEISSGDVEFASLNSTGIVSRDAIELMRIAGPGTFTAHAVALPGASGNGISIANSVAGFVFGTSGSSNFSISNTGSAAVLLDNTGAVTIHEGSINQTGAGTGIETILGGSGVISIAADVTKSTAGLLVDISGGTGGTLTLSGDLNASGSAGGIEVSNSDGTINFSGSTKTLITGGNIAVNLTGNTGAINFTNGGLNIDTTGTGFSATGGGTVTVTGSNNTIGSPTAGSGPALNVVNTNIGLAGLTFQSISANGGTNGIVLNNTGTTAGVHGGLTVTGTGTANSGGTIQNTSGAGILLANTRDVSLARMNIQSTGGSGIDGTGVTNFAFINGTINNSGDAGFESNIAFNGSGSGLGNNIAGTLTVTGSALSNGFYGGVDVQSDNGTVTNANISNNTISNPGFSGVNFVGTGNASTVFNLNKATIAGNIITSSGGNGIQISMGSSATGPGAVAGIIGDASNIISIANNTITIDPTGTQAITFATLGANSASRTQAHFEIVNNGRNGTALNSSSNGTVILIGNNGYSTMVGTVHNNLIAANHTPNFGGGNGIGGGNGVAGAGNAWTPDLTLTVTQNQISGTDGSGISLVSLGTSGIARFKIANNFVGAPVNVGGFASYGIEVLAGNSSSADDDVFLNIFGNTSAGSNGGTGIGIRKQGTTAATNEFGIYDAPGVPDLPSMPTNADVIAFINALNAAGGGTTIRNGSNYTEDTTQAPQ